MNNTDTFKTCRFCGKTQINGICHNCQRVVICSWCNLMIAPNGQPTDIKIPDTYQATHGICHPCATKVCAEEL